MLMPMGIGITIASSVIVETGRGVVEVLRYEVDKSASDDGWLSWMAPRGGKGRSVGSVGVALHACSLCGDPAIKLRPSPAPAPKSSSPEPTTPSPSPGRALGAVHPLHKYGTYNRPTISPPVVHQSIDCHPTQSGSGTVPVTVRDCLWSSCDCNRVPRVDIDIAGSQFPHHRLLLLLPSSSSSFLPPSQPTPPPHLPLSHDDP
ncbi:hypothetical protein B0T17DRAFT_17989 [Bombardia bombarda]|uniref:Uncharacterized protein n=1 Tax=Bombardia bombarda TaxID=252184 RepID=A0AA39XKL1_9PEZI|nr:hypothetical protein B0T17DRAFT_17989 [Bombardia bombarda]